MSRSASWRLQNRPRRCYVTSSRRVSAVSARSGERTLADVRATTPARRPLIVTYEESLQEPMCPERVFEHLRRDPAGRRAAIDKPSACRRPSAFVGRIPLARGERLTRRSATDPRTCGAFGSTFLAEPCPNWPTSLDGHSDTERDRVLAQSGSTVRPNGRAHPSAPPMLGRDLRRAVAGARRALTTALPTPRVERDAQSRDPDSPFRRKMSMRLRSVKYCRDDRRDRTRAALEPNVAWNSRAHDHVARTSARLTDGRSRVRSSARRPSRSWPRTRRRRARPDPRSGTGCPR